MVEAITPVAALIRVPNTAASRPGAGGGDPADVDEVAIIGKTEENAGSSRGDLAPSPVGHAGGGVRDPPLEGTPIGSLWVPLVVVDPTVSSDCVRADE